MSIATNIRAARAAANLTQAQVSAAAGLSPQQYGRYETGATEPRAQSLEKIAAALGCSAKMLVGASSREQAYKLGELTAIVEAVLDAHGIDDRDGAALCGVISSDPGKLVSWIERAMLAASNAERDRMCDAMAGLDDVIGFPQNFNPGEAGRFLIGYSSWRVGRSQ